MLYNPLTGATKDQDSSGGTVPPEKPQVEATTALRQAQELIVASVCTFPYPPCLVNNDAGTGSRGSRHTA